MIRYSLTLAVSVVALTGFASAPAHAGFDWVPPAPVAQPATPSNVAPENVAMPPVDAAPIAVTSEPMVIDAPKDVAVVPVMPETTEAALSEKKEKAALSTPPAMTEPVIATTTQAEPVKITSTPSDRPSAKQDRKTAVYPPPYNAPAAPLAGNRLSATGLVMPTPSATPMPVVATASPRSDDVTWNKRPVTDATEPVISSAPVSVEPKPALDAPIVSTPASSPVMYGAIDGFGKNIPLSLALEQVVPKDYTLVYAAKPDLNTIVSWTGGRSWNAVLSDMLYAHGFRAVITDKTVKIVSASSVPEEKVVPTKPVKEAAVTTPAPKAPATTATFDATKVDIFSARAGESVQDVLAKWTAQSNVQLYWQADQTYTLKQPVSFNSTFPRAVEQLLNIFHDQAGRPIAKLHPNAPQGPAVLAIESAKEQTLSLQ